jgi:hypothetical protein
MVQFIIIHHCPLAIIGITAKVMIATATPCQQALPLGQIHHCQEVMDIAINPH